MFGTRDNQPPATKAKGVIYWGETCFVEHRLISEDATYDTQPFEIKKYDSDWGYCLDREEDALELARRLDERAKKNPLERGL